MAQSMRFVRATIRPIRLEQVLDALARVGLHNPSVTDTKIYGQQGPMQICRGAQFPTKYLPMLEINAAVPSEQVERVARAIADAARTGQGEDGDILVFDLDHAQRICIGEVSGNQPRQAA